MIVRQCTHEGCTVLTIGPVCMQHAPPVSRTFPRGRPFTASTPRLEAARGLAVTTAVPRNVVR